MTPELAELEDAACNVIHIIKQIPDLEHLKLAIIGGLALWHYLLDSRPTSKIKFITNIQTNPNALKKKLLELPNSGFSQCQQNLVYRSRYGQDFQVDIRPEWHFRYLPESARYIHQIPYGEIPYISLLDLVVFKLDFSSLCCDPKKRHQEAFDAVALIEHAIAQQSLNSNTASATGHGQRQVTESVTNPMIQLSPRQERAVEEALCDVTWCGGRGKSWWEACLGLPRRSSARRSRINSEPGRPREVWPGGYETEAARQSRSCGIYERVADDLSAASYYERLDHPRGQLQKRSNSVGEASPEQYFYLTGKLRTWYEVYWGNIRDYWPAIADVAAAAAVPRGRSPEGRNYTTRPNLDSRSTAVNVPVNNRSHSAGSSDSGYGSYSDDQGAYPGPPKLSGGGAADRSRYHPIGGDVPSESKPCAPLETVAEVTAVGERDGDDAVDRSKDEKPGRMLRTVTFQL